MEKLSGFQKKYLRGLAHNLKPVVFIGKNGLAEPVLNSMEEALNAHEIVKVKFIDFKEKEKKRTISEELEKETKSQHVGLIGHVAIFYRMHKDPKKRKIAVPQK